MRGSEPAANAKLVFAVCVTEVFGEVALFAVNHLEPYHQDNARQNEQGPPAVDEQAATEIGDRVDGRRNQPDLGTGPSPKPLPDADAGVFGGNDLG